MNTQPNITTIKSYNKRNVSYDEYAISDEAFNIAKQHAVDEMLQCTELPEEEP